MTIAVGMCGNRGAAADILKRGVNVVGVCTCQNIPSGFYGFNPLGLITLGDARNLIEKASFCTPPESVTIKAAFFSSITMSR